MAKDALYFSHDSNASRDPKITAMRAVYGSEGYGWFWMLIEMMRESDGYKLEMKSKYAFNAYAMHLQCDCNAFASFTHDCIEEFNLFASDGECFWSESLMNRMEIKDEKSKKARESANARWEKKRKNANASKINANAPKNDAYKERKGNKEYIDHFDTFWELYPSKKGKEKARAKFISYGNKIDIEKVLEGTKKYTAYCKAKDRTLMDGSTFVNNQSWNDDWELTTNVSQFPTDKRKEFLEAQKEARTKDYGPRDIPEHVRGGL